MQDFLDALKREATSNKGIPVLQTYIKGKLWERLDPASSPDANKPISLKPLGKGWMAHRFGLLDYKRANWIKTRFQETMINEGKSNLLIKDRQRAQFPAVARIDDDAELGRDVYLPPGTTLPDTSDYVAHKQGSSEWLAWEEWHKAMDYPFIYPSGEGRFAWFPPDIPPIAAVHETQNEDEHFYG